MKLLLPEPESSCINSAFLVAINNKDTVEAFSSLEELSLLLGNLGIKTVGKILQRRQSPDPGSFVGSGKAEEIGVQARSLNAGRLVVDGSLSPGQAANLGD